MRILTLLLCLCSFGCAKEELSLETNVGGSAKDKNSNSITDIHWPFKSTSVGADGDFWFVSVGAAPTGEVYAFGVFWSSITVNGQVYTSGGMGDVILFKFSQDLQKILWVKAMGGNHNEHAFGMQVDQRGDIIITILSQSTDDLQLGNFTNTNAGGHEVIVAKLGSATGNVIWAKQSSSDNCLTNSYGSDMDSKGNYYLVGTSECAALTFDAGKVLTQVGGREAFLVKYSNSDGSVTMLKELTGPGYQEALLVEVDKNDNIYVAGTLYDSMDRGDGIDITSENASFIIKYDKQGNVLWTSMHEADTTDYTWPSSMKSDHFGNLYFAAGFTEGTVIVDGDTLTAPDEAKHYIAKINAADGTVTSIKEFDDGNGNVSSYDWGISLETDKDGNLYVLGNAYEELAFDGQLITLDPANDAIFLIKYDPQGNYVYHKYYEGEYAGTGNDYYADPMIKATDDGRLIFHGWFVGSMDVEGVTRTIESDGAWGGLLISMDQDGVIR